MTQRRFETGQEMSPNIINASDSHMALVLVLDISYSMDGQALRQLNEGVNRFKAQVCQDKQTRAILDVAIIWFNDSHGVLQDFVPVEYMEHIQMVADGGTKFTGPIREALQMVDERSRFYRRSGSEPYKPWILLISDGEPLDSIDAVAREVKEAQDDGRVRFIAVGCGDCNMAKLKKITDVVFRMEGTDFTSLFNWVAKSMRAVSTTAPGEKPPLPPLEGNVFRDVSDI